ncbi:MAG: SOS response-associated peptidase family protein [Verrucomicrobia bacterium]|nr:SOS response-associated peptidase family protein [Verrucomicrobiota bacterium]
MCNFYRVKPKRGAQAGVRERVSAMAEESGARLVRKSDAGLVVLPDRRVVAMRWGFRRDFGDAVNNARSDKLEGGMWSEAFRDRRCVIPVSVFYEWGSGEGGRKQAYEFCHADDDYLWMAGVWEEHGSLGPCYSMVTTSAGPAMAGIHDRMPAILATDADAATFLRGAAWRFVPYQGELAVSPCVSPLARPAADDGQAELF